MDPVAQIIISVGIASFLWDLGTYLLQKNENRNDGDDQ